MAKRTYETAFPELKCSRHSDAGEMLPRSSFSRTTLTKIGRSNCFACNDCSTRLAALKTHFEDKDDKGRVWHKTKNVCSCKRFMHDPVNERCPLRQQTVWPGSDFPGRLATTRSDVEFLDRCPLTSNYAWWHKRMGRRMLAPSHIHTSGEASSSKQR